LIIGLSGYARSGKDEAAKVLVEQYGFTRIAFADKLRDFLYALNPIINPTPERYFVAHPAPKRLREVIDNYGWDGYKETEHGTEIRGLLQRLGTEAGRQTLWDSIWIDAAFADTSEDNNYVITDVRFPNEADAVKERGGVLWRIERAGVGPANSHASETSLDNYEFDRRLANNGTLDDYIREVTLAYKLS